MSEYNVLDLFCGAGGLSSGFEKAGFNVRLGVDHNDVALRTFSANHKNSTAMKLDLFDLDNTKRISEWADENNVKFDVLMGGPPCQGFSLSGKRDKDDQRNKLYRAMVKVAEELRPKVVVLENVEGILSMKNGKVAKRIKQDFKRLGYNVDAKKLCAADYGVPQLRNRVLFVCLLNSKEKFTYPKPYLTKEEYVTVGDALSDLPKLADNEHLGGRLTTYDTEPSTDYQRERRRNAKVLYNHERPIHSESKIKDISITPEGGKYYDLLEDMKGGGATSKVFKQALIRLDRKKPSITILCCGVYGINHYEQNRALTPRENARLQSFDDDFIFYGNKSEQYRQIGNAVPPLLGRAVAVEVKKWLEKENGNTTNKKNK